MSLLFIIDFIVSEVICNMDFEKWKEDFSKTYENLEKESKAKDTFLKSNEIIEAHNKKFEQNLTIFHMAHNQFSDLTEDEFQRTVLMDSNLMPHKRLDTDHILPSEFPDKWKSYGIVDLSVSSIPTKDQGFCGSSWIFSSVALIEFNLYKRFGYNYAVSEQNILDCASKKGCSGGAMHWCFNYYLKNGIDYQQLYPYFGKKMNCSFQKISKNDGTGIPHHIAPKWHTLPNDEDVYAFTISKHGWISVCIAANALQFYSDGIITASECPTNSEVPNHCITLVGYGTDMPNKMPYWIIRNSWGTKWGVNGYFRMQRGKNTCNLANPYPYMSLVLN